VFETGLLGGISFLTLENAAQMILARLYVSQPPPTKSLSGGSPKQVERNAEIRALYAQGLSILTLARQFGISNARVHQILTGKR
jgi:helix-turn-helix resolvase-like protein